ncbi:pilus assembly protein TadG-related protein [uncultured Alsobacter sp.]|uniref:pilus assembly protein TadG-related protein n=1 Tax=uncultured Alsobacter sp. TaxID=1748258 RepID=UPI0025F76180|nr:pilus assembly protein TadG-related protein [uncultured Alsobacter sp.]
MSAVAVFRSCLRFLRHAGGALSPAFAVMLVPTVLVIGIGVDYNTTLRIRTKLQTAADMAVLAAAKLEDTDASREATAKRYFESQLPHDVLAMVKTIDFKLAKDLKTITGSVQASVPTSLTHIIGQTAMATNVTSTAAIAKPSVRQLDIVMCVDATGSMTATLNAVKANVLNFESNLNAELTKRGTDKFDLIRARVIYYRDYGGIKLNGNNTYVYVWNSGTYVNKYIKASDPDYWTYVGDIPPMKASGFFELPAKRTDMQTFVNPEVAWGGGDLPEAGLECVNEAMDSPWAKVGDVPPALGKAIEAIYPVIVVWTDAAAHKPNYSVSVKNPNYPSAQKFPRSYPGLLSKWNDPAVVNQLNMLLIFFGNPDLNSNDDDGKADGWQTVKTWPRFTVGGTLTEGNQNMVSKIADAIAKVVKSPTLTN